VCALRSRVPSRSSAGRLFGCCGVGGLNEGAFQRTATVGCNELGLAPASEATAASRSLRLPRQAKGWHHPSFHQACRPRSGPTLTPSPPTSAGAAGASQTPASPPLGAAAASAAAPDGGPPVALSEDQEQEEALAVAFLGRATAGGYGRAAPTSSDQTPASAAPAPTGAAGAAAGTGGGPAEGFFPGGLTVIEDGYDTHPCMEPLVQLLERAAALTGPLREGGEVRTFGGGAGGWRVVLCGGQQGFLG
jgi:hypothetical protein